MNILKVTLVSNKDNIMTYYLHSNGPNNIRFICMAIFKVINELNNLRLGCYATLVNLY